MPLIYRAVTEADVDQLFEVRTSVLENQIDLSLIPRELVLEVLNDGGSYLCADNGYVVGFSMATASGSIFALFVRPEYEGQGIGKRSLQEALNYLKAKGLSQATLDTAPDTRADAFYQKQGWVRGELNEDGDVTFVYDLSAIKD